MGHTSILLFFVLKCGSHCLQLARGQLPINFSHCRESKEEEGEEQKEKEKEEEKRPRSRKKNNLRIF
jgi:hypothetical protein